MNEIDRVKKALKVLNEDEGTSQEKELTGEEISTAISEAEAFNAALDVYADPEFDREMDEISKESDNAANDLIDLAMNVETKHTAEIASAAERFKNMRLEAQKAKINRKMKMMDMQLKERRLDLLEQKQNYELSKGTIDGDGEFIDDRDSILDD